MSVGIAVQTQKWTEMCDTQYFIFFQEVLYPLHMLCAAWKCKCSRCQVLLGEGVASTQLHSAHNVGSLYSQYKSESPRVLQNI